MTNINKAIAIDILNNLSESKRTQLNKALDINLHLTSTRTLEFAAIRIYKEGFYLKLKGARSCLNIWVFDNDGTLVEGRKPKESKLNFLYEEMLRFCESDFDMI